MEATHTRNKFNIHSKKVVLLFFLAATVFQSFSQADKHMNLPNYDNRFLHYGFSVAGNYSVYRIQPSPYFANQSYVQSIRSVNSYSFALGFILNMRLAEFFDLRLLPSVAFYERKINFLLNEKDGLELAPASYQSSFIELPLLVKYKSQRRGNHRMYMTGGLKPGFAVGDGEKDKRAPFTTGKDLSIEAGMGLDVYYELFKFSPELRFSIGLLDLHKREDKPLSNVMGRMSTYTMTLFFYFE